MKVTIHVQGDELVRGAGRQAFDDVDSIEIEVGHNLFTFKPSGCDLAVEGRVIDAVRNNIRWASHLLITAGGSPAILTCQPMLDLLGMASVKPD